MGASTTATILVKVDNLSSSMYAMDWNNATSNNNASVDGMDGESFSEFIETWWVEIVLAVFLSILCLVSLVGNLLVVVAVRVDSRLHSFTNYFIVSLACADLLISVLVMPLAIVYQVLGRWPFSWWVCLSFTTLDILCCTGSILNLCAISLDRYWAIITPFEYPRRMTRKTCPVIIAAVWLLSAIIAFAQIAWRYAIGQLTDENDDEQCQISTDVYFRIFSSSSSFYGPLFVMLFTYSKIYAAAKRQQKAIKEQNKIACPSGMYMSNNSSIPEDSSHGELRSQRKVESSFRRSRQDRSESVSSPTRLSQPASLNVANSTPIVDRKDSMALDASTNSTFYHRSLTATDSLSNSPSHSPVQFNQSAKKKVSISTISFNERRSSMVRKFSIAVPQSFRKARRKLTNQATELKAFRILSVVMGVFIINWLPFFFLYLLQGFCNQCQVPVLVISICVWLGYFNSSINPFIYVFCNRQFRMAFIKLLMPSRARRNRKWLVSETYQEPTMDGNGASTATDKNSSFRRNTSHKLSRDASCI